MKGNLINQLFQVEGKTILVTGADGQLGSEICRALYEAGAFVYATDKEFKNKKIENTSIQYEVMDITKKESIGKIFKQVYEQGRRIDVLINNAGISVFEPFEERSEESFALVLDVNLKGTFFCIQAFVEYAKKNKHGGNIINIGSIYGVVSPDPRIYTDCKRVNSEVYGATKAGIIQMTKYFAVNLAQHKIRVNSISPGGILNEQSPQGEDFRKNYAYRCPMGRMANSKDMIGAVLYFSTEASSYTTGQNLVVDGGLSCW